MVTEKLEDTNLHIPGYLASDSDAPQSLQVVCPHLILGSAKASFDGRRRDLTRL